MSFKLRIVGLLALTYLSVGCPLLTRDDIEKQDEEKQLKDQVSAIQKQKADSDVHYSDLQNDIRVIAGRVEAVDHNSQQVALNNSKEIENLKQMIATFNEKLKMVEQHIDATETRLTAAIQAMANNSVSSAGSSKAESASGGKEASRKSDLFSEAEVLFSKKDFKHAIVKYQTYREKNPKGQKNSEATYKIGVCFGELGSKKDAKEFYQETVDTYPGTPAARKAKFRLSMQK